MANIKCNGSIQTNNIEIENGLSAFNNVGGGFVVTDPINIGLEMGRKDGIEGTPFINFYTQGGSSAFDSRLLAEGNQIKISADGGVFINNKPIVCSEDKTFNENDYVKLSNGLILQWMSIGWDQNTTKPYQLPTEFPNKILGLFRGIISASTNQGTQFRSSVVSNDEPTGNRNFNMTIPQVSGTKNYIFAIGY